MIIRVKKKRILLILRLYTIVYLLVIVELSNRNNHFLFDDYRICISNEK